LSCLPYTEYHRLPRVAGSHPHKQTAEDESPGAATLTEMIPRRRGRNAHEVNYPMEEGLVKLPMGSY